MASKIIVDQLEKTGGALTALTLPTGNASASQFLQNDGAGALTWAGAALAGAGFHQLVVRSSSGSATYSPAAGVTKIVVIVQGGGGGGAGDNAPGGATGGSGVVVLRFPSGATVTASPGTNTVTTLPAPVGSCKVARFTVTGTNTVTFS